MVKRLDLVSEKHLHPYKLQWLNNSGEIKVTERVKLPFSIGRYQDEVTCDVVPMQAGHMLLGRPWQFDREVSHDGRANQYSHMLLGRPWQFDREVSHDGRANQYSFVYNKRKIVLAPHSPSQVHEMQLKLAKDTEARKKNFYLKASQVDRVVRQEQSVLLMVFKDVMNLRTDCLPSPPAISRLLERFRDVFPDEIPAGLPPIRGIKIDLVPGAPLPNRPTYRMNPEETKELEKQVQELMSKGYIRESLSPCAVPGLLVPKKDGTWRMCVDC
ncbi:PREDICTED: uncharacterized protein LOC109116376 [Tarenaya hassleriana]|uniref:uncharacterized protein LOC109116376 n=1 Tax=Tarenaya hassleriana TaxID=28532 RepID=UPI0008FD31D7|nr:PREDICTED: uncharacterized protein LOC109116376 [Tarenaya hassleriana]